MEINFFLIYCLMAVSLSMTQTENVSTTPSLKSTQSTGRVTLFNTTVSSGNDSGTIYTSAVTGVSLTSEETTVQRQTTQSTAIMTQQKHSTSLTTPGTQTQSPTVLTTRNPTTAGYTSTVTSTPDTTVTLTADSSHTVNTTLNSEDRITHGSGLNDSEKNMTIIFTVGLGTFLVTLVLIMIHRCKHRVQYLHQPLNDSDNTDAFVADDNNTLVISGGLYGSHPIYDNLPGVQEEPPHFRLDFLR